MGKRNREIARISNNQLSHDVDLPRKKIRVHGKEQDVYEVPVDPSYFEHRSNYVLPPQERTYIEGRSWTIR